MLCRMVAAPTVAQACAIATDAGARQQDPKSCVADSLECGIELQYAEAFHRGDGRIAKPIGLIKEALREFYASEKDDEAEKPETTDMKVRKDKNINKTAEAIKSMLTVVKRKWTKWELPRVPWLPYTV